MINGTVSVKNLNFTKNIDDLIVKRICFFFLFMLFPVVCFPQRKDISEQFKVRQIAQDQGLSQLNVLSIDFDENGYLWAGTEDGLNRFNGYSMTVFSQTENSKGLSDDHIRGLFYAHDTLWLATNTQSVVAYILSQNRFVPVVGEDLLKAHKNLQYAHAIFELNERYLLVSTLGNCLLIDRRTLEKSVIPIPGETPNDYVLSVTKKKAEVFLLGTFFGGILELNLKEKSLKRNAAFCFFERNPVYAFFQDNQNNWLIGTEKGLFRFHRDTQKIDTLYLPKSKNPIRCFFRWNENQILLGCYQGVMVLNQEALELASVKLIGYSKQVIYPIEVIQIKRDSSGGMWLATAGKGILYHHPKRQKFRPKRIKLARFPGKDFISIFNFLRDKNTLWLATDMGFVKHELNSGEYKLYPTDRLAYTLAKDGDNVVWGGGFQQGLQRYDPKTDRFEKVVFSEGSIPDRDIVQITAFADDSLWVASWSSGIYVVDLHELSVAPLDVFAKPVHRARTSYVDSKKQVWIGADDGLYFVVNGQLKRHYKNDPKNENSLSNNRIFSISEDKNGRIWVGTARGLNRIDLVTDSVSRYTRQPGLPNDFIYGVLTDKNGHVWVSTNYGISELNPETGKFKNYTEKDGLQNNEFNGKAAYKDNLGNLYFGGMNGFNMFSPDEIPMNQNKPQTIIEGVELFGKPLEKNMVYTDTLRFEHNENVLTFQYVSLNYLLPQKNRYRFKMEGFDKKWRPVTKERMTTYTNLNPGTYTFRVQGSNNELFWGFPDALTIIIKAPWYETTLFRVAVIVLTLLLMSMWFVLKNYRHKQHNRLLKEMVRVRTKELRDSNNALNKTAKTAREQKENVAFLMRELNHRVKNNLQLMASLLDMQMTTTKSKIVKRNLQTTQNRLFTISKIHDLLRAKEEEKNTELALFIRQLTQELIRFMDQDIHLNFDLIMLSVNKKKINPLAIILNELVTNTVKHAFEDKTTEQKSKSISITLEREGLLGKLTYKDNGKGIAAETKTRQNSLGLKLIENLALQLGGHFDISFGKGTVFVVYFSL